MDGHKITFGVLTAVGVVFVFGSVVGIVRRRRRAEGERIQPLVFVIFFGVFLLMESIPKLLWNLGSVAVVQWSRYAFIPLLGALALGIYDRFERRRSTP